jgi:choline kinase
MLAAGVGRRLSGRGQEFPPKALLPFGGKSLLERHIEVLRHLGLEELVVVVGYQAELIDAEIRRVGAGDFVRTLTNPRFTLGSGLSLWTAREVLRGENDILFMDADVLYHPALMERLLSAPGRDRLLLDRDFDPGDEPVKLCLRNGVPVEFRKVLDEIQYDCIGEWPGFLTLSAESATEVAVVLDEFEAAEMYEEPYEEAIRAVMLRAPRRFSGVDISGLPWIEIDFPEDLERARDEIYPRLSEVLEALDALFAAPSPHTLKT